MTRSLIVGCGYVGSALASQLVDQGEDVYAVTRSGVDIDGVTSLVRDVTEPGLDLPRADRVFYLVSAGGREPDAYRMTYVDGLERTIDATRGNPTVVYASSTGVYEVYDGSWVDETTTIDPSSDRARILLEAENIAIEAGGTVVRFAGLYGPERTGIERYLDGARVPAGYLNLLHREDAARSMLAAISGDHDCYLAVDDEPVHRHDLARWLAEFTGRAPGNLVESVDRSNKRCSNARLRGLGWEPAFPTYRDGFADALGGQ